MTAEELHEKYHPPTPEQCLEIAEAYIEQEGDLPEFIWYQLGLVQPSFEQSDRVWKSLTAMREAYFEELGEEMPEYTGTFI